MTTEASRGTADGDGDPGAGDASFVGEVTAALDGLLTRRAPGDPTTVLGAGNDDLTAGREYLWRLATGGWAVPSWPVEQGGMGLDQPRADLVARALRGFQAPDLYPFMVGVSLVGPTILAHGSAQQQARWLPKIRNGEEIWCQMFSEPDAGSDLANLKARAVRDGDVWRVSGSKVWTSRAHYSKWGLLLARSDPTVPKHAGITAFAVDMQAPGVEIRPLVQMNRDAHFNEVFLDEVVIPDSDRIGAEGGGWRVAITCLSHERGSLAGGLGVSLDQLLALGRRYNLQGRPALRDRLVEAIIELRIGQWTAMRAQEARRAGRPPGPEDSGAKLRTNQVLKAVASLALEAAGAAATVDGDEPDEWQTLFLVSPSLSIRGGTDEIQRNILGERVLGLPTEPRVDKDRSFAETTAPKR